MPLLKSAWKNSKQAFCRCHTLYNELTVINYNQTNGTKDIWLEKSEQSSNHSHHEYIQTFMNSVIHSFLRILLAFFTIYFSSLRKLEYLTTFIRMHKTVYTQTLKHCLTSIKTTRINSMEITLSIWKIHNEKKMQ